MRSDLETQLDATRQLVGVARDLSLCRSLAEVMSVVRVAARELTGADGATFVLRDGDRCFYAEENAIAPLWKGRRFPLTSCISGWVMLNAVPAAIEDIYDDPRIPADAYRPTFVQSLAMVPIRAGEPIGAIGNYWAVRHQVSSEEVQLLQALADLTSVSLENVQLYDQLQHKIREAELAVQVRDEFLSVASHELRTPVTALQLQLEGLQSVSGAGTDDRILSKTRRIVSTTQRLVALVEGLLDVSRIGAGVMQLNREQFCLGEAVREVAERFTETARRSSCELQVTAVGTVEGRWDRLRVEQIITNLLANAVKYGAGKPVVLDVGLVGVVAQLTVRDEGIGIAELDLQRIFERFGRAASIRNYGGLGLGLHICKQVAEAHGGAIHVKSQPGQGATFIVDLPLSAD